MLDHEKYKKHRNKRTTGSNKDKNTDADGQEGATRTPRHKREGPEGDGQEGKEQKSLPESDPKQAMPDGREQDQRERDEAGQKCKLKSSKSLIRSFNYSLNMCCSLKCCSLFHCPSPLRDCLIPCIFVLVHGGIIHTNYSQIYEELPRLDDK